MSSSRPVPIIETLFPGRRVHLIGGASGAGKTTWLMQTLESWRKGEFIHGYRSHPVPFIFLSYDRDDDDFIDTCERLKIDPSTYHFHSPHGKDFDIPLIDYLHALQSAHPETRLYIIEGIAMMTPAGKINDQRVVGSWLRKLQDFCKSSDCTIIGVLHSAKTKERDRYKEPRARIAGCGAWAGYSSTVVIIEERDSDSTSEIRDLLILPRNARKHHYVLDFKNGQLTELIKAKPIRERLTEWFRTFDPGRHFTPTDAISAINSGKTQVHAELNILEKIGIIHQVTYGVYALTDRAKAN